LSYKPGWALSDFDAVTSYWVRTPDDIRALLSDPEWAEKVSEREKHWVNTGNVVITAGWETVYLEDGQIVNTQPLDAFPGRAAL
jgi:hypothetical protein